MFNWYSSAATCIVYLDDVDAETDQRHLLETQLRGSRWFQRGWTLQELLAPESLVFVNRQWKPFGGIMARSYIGGQDAWLLRTVASIANVDHDVILFTKQNLPNVSAAERLAWMHGRKTTREEDMAYCLFGVFDINMPLLYGEGAKAFRRMQVEVLSQLGDESILVWACTPEYETIHRGGLLATSIENFANGNVERCITHSRTPFTISSYLAELQVGSSDQGIFRHKDEDILAVRLNCVRARPRCSASPCVIFLQQQHCGHFRREFRRKHHSLLCIRFEDEITGLADWIEVSEPTTMLIHLHASNDCFYNKPLGPKHPVNYHLGVNA